jgi:transcriptional regulator with XRE-family HTH domain
VQQRPLRPVLKGVMIAKDIVEELRPYGIGEKLRSLRLRKSMGLVQLGQHTGLSPAMLSKLERGRLFPTLPTLTRIAMVFSVGLDYFFTDEKKRHVVAVVRKKDRLRFPERPKITGASYYFESLDFPATERKLNAYFAEFENVPEEKLRPHQHATVEFLYLISGSVEIRIASALYTLEAGDSIYFDASVRHSYRNPGKNESSGLVVTVP